MRIIQRSYRCFKHLIWRNLILGLIFFVLGSLVVGTFLIREAIENS